MGSVITEKEHLENGNCSLSIAPPKYKRRKVSAVRDFPPGCGRNAAPINSVLKEVEDVGVGPTMSVVSKDVESSDVKEGDHCDREGNGFSEGVVESQSHDIPVCSSSPKEAYSLEKPISGGNGSNELLELPVDLGSNGLPSNENPIVSQNSVNVDEGSVSRDKIYDPVMEVRVESPRLLENTSILALQEAGTDVRSEILAEGTILEMCSLPHHPIPCDVVRKERKYPLRRRVSAVRDFPPGCGRTMQLRSEAADKHSGLDVTGGSTCKEVERKDENQIGGSSDAKGIVSAKSGGEREGRSEAVEGIFPDVNMHASQIDESVEIMGIKETSEVSGELHEEECDEKDEGDMRSSADEVRNELIVYVREKIQKKSLIGGSCDDNESLAQSIVGIGNKELVVIVQGLMAASKCPETKGKPAVLSSPSVSSVKRSKGKKHECVRQDKPKNSPNKSKGKSESLGESSKMIVPYLEETETKEVSDVLRDEGDSTDNESLNDFQLVPRNCNINVTLPPFGVGSSSERGARNKVRKTLRLFQAIVRKLQQGEESKSKDKENTRKRIDLRASSILKVHGKFVNTNKKGIVGPIPGVEVGDIFNFRIELSIIGLHRPPQAGIDFVKKGQKIIATSIVASGGYANDMYSSDVLVYTGQGGNAKGGDKQPEDQKLERGNLALKNSIDEKNFVRVIRGFKETKSSESPGVRSKINATYTYDGLYTVEKYWHDIGPHGKLVYKFELRRVLGQPELAWKEVKRSKKFVREGRVVLDVSEAKETCAISAINTIDDEKPPPFTYTTIMMYPDWCQPLPPKGCECKNGCSDFKHCSCALKNGGEIPYNHNGAIVEAKPLVYECGPSCSCPPTCYNRASQYGIKIPLEIFKTESRGWGVRSLSPIPSGSFICEYIGELLDDKEAELRTGNDEYLFDIGQNYNDPTLWDGLSTLMPDLASSSSDVVENIGFTIDAAKYGNIGRFINHSCSPNLYAQNVLYDHEDKRIPHIMFFAAENIPPLQELTYHYNYSIDQVFDRDGNIIIKNCYCGSSECTGRMY